MKDDLILVYLFIFLFVCLSLELCYKHYFSCTYLHCLQVYLFSRPNLLWLNRIAILGCTDKTIHWFTSSSSERETPNSRKLKNAFPVCCRNKQRNFTTNQGSCFRNTRRKWRSSGWRFSQVKLCLFDLNLSIKPAKKFCSLQMQIKFKSCVTFFSWLVHK